MKEQIYSHQIAVNVNLTLAFHQMTGTRSTSPSRIVDTSHSSIIELATKDGSQMTIFNFQCQRLTI